MNRVAVEDEVCASGLKFRDLSTRDECAAVVALEREIWGPDYDEGVPLALLLMSAAHGAILIGAFDNEDLMVGFVYSLFGMKNGRPIQWSYKLGVARRCRNEGVGRQLKLLQRERALEMGIDHIEWTFDPMFAPNAYLNLTKLGAIVQEYREDLYGESLAPVMHRKIPTDRFVAIWNIRDARVAWLLSSRIATSGSIDEKAAPFTGGEAARLNRAVQRGKWLECSDVSLDTEGPRLLVEIPLCFGEMIMDSLEVALDWRMTVRRIFSTYFRRGYCVNEFASDPPNRRGVYTLVPTSQLSPRDGFTG